MLFVLRSGGVLARTAETKGDFIVEGGFIVAISTDAHDVNRIECTLLPSSLTQTHAVQRYSVITCLHRDNLM